MPMDNHILKSRVGRGGERLRVMSLFVLVLVGYTVGIDEGVRKVEGFGSSDCAVISDCVGLICVVFVSMTKNEPLLQCCYRLYFLE